ncbi:MAG: DUF6600 domain-containing protein, partial [Chthoniobacterales bacterium]
MSKLTMKKYFLLPLIAALAFGIACQKQQTEEERRAEVERQVQERLATERQADEKARLAQQQADLDAREKALAAKEAATAAPPAEEPPVTSSEETTSETSETRSETVSAESYGTFYEKLEPYGAWRETADYGYVWQPREAEESRDWRPYTEGRWAYSDAGWTWISDESFGWATYHYGRWLRLRRVGWVWVPGNEWAPAWVSWRTSKEYVGWAPLPPEARFDRRQGIHNWADNYYDIGPDQYAFVRGEEFGAPHVRRSLVPAQENVTIVNATINVTNITFSNTIIINQGPNFDEIRARSRQPMERYRLRRHSDINTELRSATVRGDEIDVAVPQFRNVPGVRRPRSIREKVSDATVDNGWSAVADRSAAERTRAKMRAEATPPPNAPPKKFVKPSDTGNAPAVSATAVPAATPAVAATASPAPIATVAPTARPSSTLAPTASPTPRVRQSPSITPRATLAPVAPPSPTPVVAPTATPAIPAVSPSPSAAVLPVVRPSPPVSLRASPSVAPLTDPAAADKAEKLRRLEEARKNRPLPNKPAPAASIPPSPPAVEHTAPVQPPRKGPPVSLNTPPPVSAPSLAPPATQPTAVPRLKPALTPPATQPTVVPRPKPPITPPVSETAPAPVPPTVAPKRIPPRAAPPVVNTPPAVTDPAAPPSAPPSNDGK